jgi:hypothetical protein
MKSRLLRTALLVLAILLIRAERTAAQKPGAVNPQAPTLAPVLPLGVQRGTTLELTLTGTNLAEPTGLWTSFPAKVTIPTDRNNGKSPTSLRVKFEVPADAPLGFHSLRLATRRGMSNARLFCIDELPQVAEVATNRSPDKAQLVPVPCVVVAKADAEVTDYFKFTVKAGQRLSFDVLGRRLGSAFDPELTLYDSAGTELPGGHSNDAPGLQTDARLSYTFKNAGAYVVAVRDTTYRGAPDFHYRLRIGDFPCATTPLPLAAKRGSKVTVRFSGTALDGVAPVEVQVPSDPAVAAVQVAPKGPSGLHGWPVELAVSDLDEGLEKEPNNDAARANRLTVPGAVTGRFETAEDVDCYVFSAKKGQRVIIEAHAMEHHSPTEVDLVLRNARGAQLQASNPAAPPRLDFTAPADGDYVVEARHLHGWGGPDEVYRLTLVPFAPDFSLTLPLDRFDVPAGGTTSLPIRVGRAGYNGPVEVSVVGPKGLSGQVVIPAGPPRPPTVPSGVLTLKAADLPPGPLVFHVQGKATINGKVVVKFASVAGVLSQSLANLPVPPRTMIHSVGLAVTEKPPFSLSVKPDAPYAPPGKPTTLTVTLTRAPGFAGEVGLVALGLPPGVTLAPGAKVPAGAGTAKVTLNLTPAVKVGQVFVTLRGTASHMGRAVAATAAPVRVVVKK